MGKTLSLNAPKRTVKSSSYVAETVGNAFASLFDGQDVNCEMIEVGESIMLTFHGNGIVARLEMGEMPSGRSAV